MANPNPLKTCETCALSEPMYEYDRYTCNNYTSERHPISGDTSFICGVTADRMNYITGNGALPKDDACRDCPFLTIGHTVIVQCHLLNQTVGKDGNDYCGQWQEKGSF